jgi:uncharacterized protein YybS (DUF2232 family)
MIESSHLSEPVALPDRSFGRVTRSVIGYGVLTALMVVFGIPVFVPAMLIHCAIRNGRRAAWASLVLATLLATLSLGSATAAPDVTRLALSFISGVVLSVAVPAILAVPLVERGEAFGRVLLFLLVGSAIGLAATEIGARAIAGFSPYAAHVAQAKEASVQIVQTNRTAGMPSDAVRWMERWGAVYSTVLLPAAMLLNTALSFVLSLLMIGRLRAWREMIVRREATAGGAYLFRNFALPDWVLFAFVLGGLTPLATGLLQKVAANVLMLVVFLYVLQGFALLRFLLAAVGVGFLGALVASLFAVFTGIGPLLLGIAGLFDPFFDFRHFKKRKDDSHESHSD